MGRMYADDNQGQSQQEDLAYPRLPNPSGLDASWRAPQHPDASHSTSGGLSALDSYQDVLENQAINLGTIWHKLFSVV